MSCLSEKSTDKAKLPMPARSNDQAGQGSWALRLVLVGMLFTVPASAENWQSTLELSVWQRHAAEGRLLELDSVRQLLRRFQEREGFAVIVRHPGGDLGSAIKGFRKGMEDEPETESKEKLSADPEPSMKAEAADSETSAASRPPGSNV